MGSEARIQLNDKFAGIKEIKEFVIAERVSERESLYPFLVTSLKMDKGTKRDLIEDIKNEHKRVNVLKINYTTRVGEGSNNLQS